MARKIACYFWSNRVFPLPVFQEAIICSNLRQRTFLFCWCSGPITLRPSICVADFARRPNSSGVSCLDFGTTQQTTNSIIRVPSHVPHFLRVAAHSPRTIYVLNTHAFQDFVMCVMFLRRPGNHTASSRTGAAVRCLPSQHARMHVVLGPFSSCMIYGQKSNCLFLLHRCHFPFFGARSTAQLCVLLLPWAR
jgi:hypothetical protein